MKKLMSLLFLALACQPVFADGGAKAKAGSNPAAAPAGSYVVEKKSAFSGTTNDHNPFWPIGWVKVEESNVSDEAPMIPKSDDFLVSSILLNEPRLAVINGKDSPKARSPRCRSTGRT